jgi:hypothetical protein
MNSITLKENLLLIKQSLIQLIHVYFDEQASDSTGIMLTKMPVVKEDC